MEISMAKLIALIKSISGGGGGGGGGGGVLKIAVNPDTGALDKTWKEIHDAGFAVVMGDGSYMICVGIWNDEEGVYEVDFWPYGAQNPNVYTTDSENGYPVLSE